MQHTTPWKLDIEPNTVRQIPKKKSWISYDLNIKKGGARRGLLERKERERVKRKKAITNRRLEEKPHHKYCNVHITKRHDVIQK